MVQPLYKDLSVKFHQTTAACRITSVYLAASLELFPKNVYREVADFHRDTGRKGVTAEARQVTDVGPTPFCMDRLLGHALVRSRVLGTTDSSRFGVWSPTCLVMASARSLNRTPFKRTTSRRT
jgi:hypothetical protein